MASDVSVFRSGQEQTCLKVWSGLEKPCPNVFLEVDMSTGLVHNRRVHMSEPKMTSCSPKKALTHLNVLS